MPEWDKNAYDIVNQISEETCVFWDTDSILAVLVWVIMDLVDQETFTQAIRRQAQAEIDEQEADLA